MNVRRPTFKTITPLLLLAVISAAPLSAPARTRDAIAGPQKQKKKSPSDETSAQRQCERGAIALRYGLTDEAVRYGQLAVSLDPNFFDGWALLGSAYYTKAEYALAAEAYEKAAAIKPTDADIHKNLGLALSELQETDRAEAALKKAYDLGGGFEPAYYLGKLYFNAKRYEEALDFALKSIQKNGKSAGAYNLKGVTLNQLKRFAEAAGSFQAGLVLAPDDLGLKINLGVAYLNGGDPAKAKAIFEEVLPKVEQDVLRRQVENYLKAIKDAGK